MKDGKMLQQEAEQRSKDNVEQITVPKHSFHEPDQKPWTAKVKKNTVVTFEVDGKKTSLPIAAYLKQEALKLPPIEQNGKRVVHFNEMMWRFMHGTTKTESQQAVDQYCADMVEIWNKAVEENRQALKEKTEGLIFEDELPEMTDEQYSEWFEKSQLVEGVRMGPIIEKNEVHEDDN